MAAAVSVPGESPDLKHLHQLLTNEELSNLSNPIICKIESYIDVKFDEFLTSKALFEAGRKTSAEQIEKLESGLFETTSNYEHTKAKLEALDQTKQEVETQLEMIRLELGKTQDSLQRQERERETFRRQRDEAVDERDHLMNMLDRRNTEIDQMKTDLSDLSSKLQAAINAKCEALSKANEIQSKELALDYKEQRIDQEKTLLKNQNDRLLEELNRYSSELQAVRLNHSSRTLDLETQLSQKTEDLALCRTEIGQLNESRRTLTQQIEALTQSLAEQQEMDMKMCQNYKKELEAKTKLADLYKNMQEDNNAKSEELGSGIAELQKLLNEATDKYGELETKHKQMEADHEEILEKRNETINNLKRELENANDLLQAAKNESYNMAVEELSPSAAVASKLIKSGMSYTQIFTQMVQISDELLKEKEENKRLQQTLSAILSELEEKAPQLRQQQIQYEEALEHISAITQQHDSLAVECNQLRDDYAESVKVSNHFQRENQRLKGDITDLGRQVCFLLKEVELGRGSSLAGSADQDSSATMTTTSTTSSSEHSSSRVISKNLVTFSDIQELQANNQKLLKLVRDLTDKYEEIERQKDQFETGDMQAKLETLTNRVVELTDAQDRQTKMLNGVIRQRDMYKKRYLDNMKNLGQDVSLNMDKTDCSMDLNDSNSKSTMEVSHTATPAKSNEIQVLEQQLQETKRILEQQKLEHKTFKEEMSASEKMMIEQQEKMHKEYNELTASYAKCVSQCEYSNERFKVLQTNANTYKKQIALLEEKNKIYSNSIMKHEMSLNHMRDEAMNAQGKLAKVEVMLESLKREYAFLKNSETRVIAERDALKEEQKSRSILLSNLEFIKVSLERNHDEGRIKLESRLDNANMECSALRRRLQEEQDRFRELTSYLEKQTEQAKSRMEEEKAIADNVKGELATLREELTAKSNHMDELSKKLASAINPTKMDGSFDSAKRLKELENQLKEKQGEIESLQQQLTTSKEHCKQYCDISECAERELKNASESHNEYKASADAKINQLQVSENELKEKCAELEAELSLQSDGQHQTTSGLKSQLIKLQESLKTTREELKEKTDNLEVARSELAKMSENVQVTEDKYANELVLHSNDIQTLTKLKEDFSKLNQDIVELTTAKEQAMETLNASQAAWKEHESTLAAEKLEIANSYSELQKQNSLLLDQIQTLSTQMAVQVSKHSDSMNESADASLNRSMIEDQVSSSDQLIQIIKHLRKERDILFAKFDILQAENMRIKAELNATEKKLDEAKLELRTEREKSDVNSATLMKHSEILRKVETLNAITDSNMILREERDTLLTQVNQLSETCKKLEESLSPLQEKNQELSTKLDSMQSENVSLKAESGRWRTRVSALVERANKTSPEDWKRLQNERETLAKMLTTEKENVKKMNEEATANRLEKARLEDQVNNLSKQHLLQTEELRKHAEELASLKKDFARVSQELGEARNIVTQKTEENNKANENLTAKENVLAEIRNKEMQIRKIAKKYKSQYEELVKTVEEDKKKSEVLASETAQSTQTVMDAQKELQQKVADMEKTHTEKLAELNAQVAAAAKDNEVLQKEMESLKAAHASKEELGQNMLSAAKSRIATLTEQKNTISKELSDIKVQYESAEQNKEESDTRLGLLKSQYDMRLGRLEKEKADAQQEAQQKQQDVARLNREMETLLQKVNQLQRQLGNQQAAKPSTSSGQGEKPGGDPPTANIKPMAGVGGQQSVGGRRVGGETPFASIRPMASHVGARTAAVLPTSAQPPSPAHPPTPPTPHHQTPHTTGSVSGDVLSSSPSSSHHTTEYMPASSSARHHPHHVQHHPRPTPPESTQDMESEVAGGTDSPNVVSGLPIASPQTPSTAQAVPQQAVALVLPRIEPPATPSHSHVEPQPAPHPQHSSLQQPQQQQQACSSSGGNSSSGSSAVTTSHPQAGPAAQQQQHDKMRAAKRMRPPPEHTLKNKRSRTQGFQGVTESEVEYQVPTSSQRDQEDDGVIVVDSEDEENQYGDNYQDDNMYMGMEEEAEEEDDDDDDDDEGGEGVVGEDEEDDDDDEDDPDGGEGCEEEEEDDEDMDGEEEADEEGGAGDREAAGASSEVLIDDSSQQEMPAQSGALDVQEARGGPAGGAPPSAPTSPSPSASPSPAQLPSRQQQIQTITSGTEGGVVGSALMLGGVGGSGGPSGPSSVSGAYEDGDDGIVPSTPTLYVPRRNDGFGEAVSSPGALVGAGGSNGGGGRFTFGDSSGTGGIMEDTHADLTPQLNPHHPPHGEVPSITVTEPSSAEESVVEESSAGSSQVEASSAVPDEDSPTVSSQGSQPVSPQQMEEGREAEASSPSRGAMRSRRPYRGNPRPNPVPHHRGSPHPRRPTPIIWGGDGDGRGGHFMQRGMARGRRPNRRPQHSFMRF